MECSIYEDDTVVISVAYIYTNQQTRTRVHDYIIFS